MQSLTGKLLLAAPQMGDPNFEKTVVLLVQHGSEGAVGLVLNRPTDTAVSEALGPEAAECETGAMLYRGGPCEGPLMVLHGGDSQGQEPVIDGVYFATDRQFIEPVLAGDVAPAKFFAGYAGWGAQQLETELSTGSWLVVDASAASVFDADDDAWRRLVRRSASRQMFANFNPDILPDDPSMN